MPFTFSHHTAPTPEQANPFNAALKSALQMYNDTQKAMFLHPQLQEEYQKAQLANELAKIQNKYAEPTAQEQLQQLKHGTTIKGVEAQYAPQMAEQGLLKEQQHNKYYGRGQESEISLRKAQESKAIADSLQARMLANAYANYMGEQTNNNIKDTGQDYSTRPMNEFSGQINNQPFNSSNRSKKMLQAFGHIKETPDEQQEREAKTAYDKAQAESDVKKIGQLEDIAIAGIQSEPTYQEAAEITSNPAWAKMRDFPLAPGLQLSYYKRNGSPEQREMIGKFESKTNQFILDSIKLFPQRFTNQDLQFMLGMKVSGRDSLESGQAKLYSAYSYMKILSERSGIAAQIARERRISVTQALKIADKMIDGNKIRKQIEEQVKGKSNKIYRNKKTGEEISEEEAKIRGII
jgi:hypothetical protein